MFYPSVVPVMRSNSNSFLPIFIFMIFIFLSSRVWFKSRSHNFREFMVKCRAQWPNVGNRMEKHKKSSMHDNNNDSDLTSCASAYLFLIEDRLAKWYDDTKKRTRKERKMDKITLNIRILKVHLFICLCDLWWLFKFPVLTNLCHIKH